MKRTMARLLAAAFLASTLLAARSGQASERVIAIREQELLATPQEGSTSLTHLAMGTELEVLGHQGAYYQVRDPHRKQGWVQIFAVRIASLSGVKPKPAVRFLIKTRSVVMGVRGLDEVDLKTAQPDLAALDELERYAADPESLGAFSHFKKQKLVPTDSGSPATLSQADENDEHKTGQEIAATLLGGASLVAAPDLQRYVNQVGTWVALRSDRPRLPWRFGVLASDSINAFACPGGFIFITLGLYQRLATESELAGVLGHEISHVVARDHYRILLVSRAMKEVADSMKKMKTKLTVLKSGSVLTTSLAAQVFSVALDRAAETSADRLGMMLAADAGYEPFGLPRVLQLLEYARPDDPNLSLLFKTHPAPAERIQAVAPLLVGRLSQKASDPDLSARFEKYDFRGLKLERKAGTRSASHH